MLNVSIVLYNNDIGQLLALCEVLTQVRCLNTLWLIDNSPKPLTDLTLDQLAQTDSKRIQYLWNNGKSFGYGAAHNIAIRQTIEQQVRYHLVMNADIEVKAEDIDRLHLFMEKNLVVGSLMPRVVYPDGRLQPLCKLLPTPLDVFGRRFLPKRLINKRNNRYELRFTDYDKMMNVPYLSGCFMLLRTKAVKEAGLFDERYFMYPEDIDLTRRIHRNWLTLYVPDITIVHNHTQASYKSLKMTLVHIVNMCRYFNKWGWWFDSERRLVNRLTIESLNKKD